MTTNSVTVLNRTAGAYDFPYVDPKGGYEKNLGMNMPNVCYCTLAPNITTAIPEYVFALIKNHPLFVQLAKKGQFQVLQREDLKITGATKNGLLMVDDPIFGEGLTVVDYEQAHKKNKAYVPSKDFLMQFKGVGKTTAEKILNAMPDGGWKDFTAMKSAVNQLPGCGDIDWSETKL